MIEKETFAERLGWRPGDRAVIIHVDDAGMSHESNRGAMRAIADGAATSCSVMAPCAWTSEFAHY
ncbi:MAG TPA: ChbG/HpnK family deacetylase, partial [Candidatus Hydrogenedentes bacterium]|nr:ChbG/HpnK family deacetylase [Candidatus Hydrogenedentota bacterium]